MEEYSNTTKTTRYSRRMSSRGQKVQVVLPIKKSNLLKQTYWKNRTKKAIHMARDNKYFNMYNDNVCDFEKKNNYDAWEKHLQFLEQQSRSIRMIF